MSSSNPSTNPSPSSAYLLLESDNLNDLINVPLKSSQRIKYTCFCLSSKYIICGATSGGLYIFDRNTYAFLQLLPNKEGQVTLVDITMDEKYIAFATQRSIICILELQQNLTGKVISSTDELADSVVTILHWTENNILFVGDSDGRVWALKSTFLNTNLLNLPIMQLDSRIVQIDSNGDFLVVSTLTKCYVCNTTRKHFKPIGQRLRNGVYGACFLSNENDTGGARIFCARPGSRLWEVDYEGTVCSTHLFKRCLAQAPFPFVSLYEVPKLISSVDCGLTEWPKQSLNFCKLLQLCQKFIFTFTNEGIYIFDVENVNVVFWSNHFKNIVDARCIGNKIYLWTSIAYIYELTFLSVSSCILKLYYKQHYELCKNLLVLYCDTLTSSPDTLSTLKPMSDIESYLELTDQESKIISLLIQKVRQSESQTNSFIMPSGMHVVKNQYVYDGLVTNGSALSSAVGLPLETGENEQSLTKARGDITDLNAEKKTASTEIVNQSNGILENKAAIDVDARSMQEQENIAQLFKSMHLYHSPFLTLASYNMLHGPMNEINVDFVDAFNIGSKRVRDKLMKLESQLNIFRKRNPIYNPLDIQIADEAYHEAYPDEDIDDLPIVESQKLQIEFAKINVQLIMGACEDINTVKENDSLEDEQAINNLLKIILEEYRAYNCCSNKKVSDCFPFSIYFPRKVIEVIENAFHSALKSGLSLTYLTDDLIQDDMDIDLEKLYPKMLQHIFTVSDLIRDFKMSKLLRIFSEVLIPLTIVQDLKSLNLPCHYLSLVTILSYFKHCDTYQRKYHKIKKSHWVMPVYLNSMLLMLSLDQLDAFCTMGINQEIDFSDVSYLTVMNEMENKDEESGKNCKSVFLTYIKKYLLIHDSESIPMDNFLILYQILKELVQVNSLAAHRYSFCKCWFPMIDKPMKQGEFYQIELALMSHFWQVYENIYNKIKSNQSINMPINYCSDSLKTLSKLVLPEQSNDGQAANEFCYMNFKVCSHESCNIAFPYFDDCSVSDEDGELLNLLFKLLHGICLMNPVLWAVLYNVQQTTELKILSVKHAIQLYLLNELEQLFKDFSLDVIYEIAQLNLKLHKGHCLNCGSNVLHTEIGIKWNDFMILTLKYVGAQSALNLVKELSLPPASLDKTFYQSCIVSSIAMPPYYDLLDERERRHVVSLVTNMGNIPVASKEVNEKILLALSDDIRVPDLCKKCPKMMTHHWGLSVNLKQAVCMSCTLPLNSRILLLEEGNSGITVFTCKHTYHTVCLKHKRMTTCCMLCENSRRSP